LSIAGYSAKANRLQAELLGALGNVAQLGLAARAGGAAAALHLAEGQLVATAQTLTPGEIQSTGATLHLSADTAAELAVALQHLAGNGGDVTRLIPQVSGSTKVTDIGTGGPAK
jgi:hypothetical protein